MRKFLSFFMVMFFAITFANAQSIVVIDDDNYYDEYLPVYDALVTGGFTVDTIDMENADTLLYSEINTYDMVIWNTGDDRVGLNLWDTITNPGTVQFYPALQQYYDNADGAIWIDGLDFIKAITIQTTGESSDNDTIPNLLPYTYSSGDFVYDVLGISEWNYESKSMGDGGVPQADKDASNTITSLDPVQWQWSTLWRGDGWTTVSGTTNLYNMGDASFPGAGYSMAYKYVNAGVNLYVSSLRLGKLGDGSAFDQTKVNGLVADIVNDAVSGSSVNEISANNINIYPNPAVNSTIVNLSGINASELKIVDITGRTVFSQKISGQKQVNLNTTDFASGIYNVIISDGKNTETAKLSVAK